MEINRLKPNETSDFTALIEIFRELFQHHAELPDHQHVHKVLSDPAFLAFVARVNDKVVGGATVYVLHQYYSPKPLAYVYDVGVHPHFQRKGIGKALLDELCRFCKNNGFEGAYVQAEYDDTDALRFYRKTRPGSEMAAIQFSYSCTKEN